MMSSRQKNSLPAKYNNNGSNSNNTNNNNARSNNREAKGKSFKR